MLAYVSYHAEATRPAEDGAPQRAHWEASARAGNLASALLLEEPPFPSALSYLYEWFADLNRARAVTPYGPGSLTYLDLDAWARLSGERPAPHEVRALFQIDDAWRSGRSETPSVTPTASPVDADAPRELVPVKPWPTKKAEERSNG